VSRWAFRAAGRLATGLVVALVNETARDDHRHRRP
jgi:hypothetical protein